MGSDHQNPTYSTKENRKVALELATTSRIYLVYYFSILIILVFTSMTAKIDSSHFKCSISKFITQMVIGEKVVGHL